jgi:hypothetical protein
MKNSAARAASTCNRAQEIFISRFSPLHFDNSATLLRAAIMEIHSQRMLREV